MLSLRNGFVLCGKLFFFRNDISSLAANVRSVDSKIAVSEIVNRNPRAVLVVNQILLVRNDCLAVVESRDYLDFVNTVGLSTRNL